MLRTRFEWAEIIPTGGLKAAKTIERNDKSPRHGASKKSLESHAPTGGESTVGLSVLFSIACAS